MSFSSIRMRMPTPSSVRLPTIKSYCTPAKTYMILAVLSIAYSFVANIGSSEVFHLGTLKTYVGNTYLVILFEIAYLFVWGWFINWLCKKRATNIAWFVVLLPYALAIMAFMGHYKMGGVRLGSF